MSIFGLGCVNVLRFCHLSNCSEKMPPHEGESVDWRAPLSKNMWGRALALPHAHQPPRQP